MSVINPIEFEELYDKIILAGVKSPGVVKLSGHDRNVNWDVKTAQGQKGATTTLKDMPPAAFTAEFYLVDDDDFEAWPAFLGLINSTVSGATPKALDIYHPDLVEQEIISVVKAGLVGTKHDGKGGQFKTVKFQEYFPPKPKGGSPVGAKKDPKNDPDAAALAELSALTNQYQDSPWGGPTAQKDPIEILHDDNRRSG